MRASSLAEIAAVVRSLDIPRNRVVMVHSGLLKFGRIEGGLAGLAQCLREVLGPDATVVMPAFTFGFGRARVWDAVETPGEVGALPEYLRRLPGARRSIHPFHSVCAIGPLANEVTGGNCASSFGAGSAFDTLARLDAINLSVGTEFEGGATFLHKAEEDLRVPYRTFQEFPGVVRDAAGEVVDQTFSLFARTITPEYEYTTVWEQCWEDLNEQKCFRVAFLRGAMFTSCAMQETLAAFSRLLLRDPFYVARLVPKDHPPVSARTP